MKTNWTFSGLKGFAVIEGILTEVVVSRVSILSPDTMCYKTNKGTFFNLALYDSRENFEKGIAHSTEIWVTNSVEENLIVEKDQPLKMKVWTMDNGEPTETIQTVALVIKYSYWAEPELPGGYYLTRRDCLNNETYKYEDENGNIIEKVGLAKALRVTEEQEKFISKELVPALKKAREMGLEIFYDDDNAWLKIANVGDKRLRLEYFDDGVDTEEYVTSADFLDVTELPNIARLDDNTYLTLYNKE